MKKRTFESAKTLMLIKPIRPVPSIKPGFIVRGNFNGSALEELQESGYWLDISDEEALEQSKTFTTYTRNLHWDLLAKYMVGDNKQEIIPLAHVKLSDNPDYIENPSTGTTLYFLSIGNQVTVDETESWDIDPKKFFDYPTINMVIGVYSNKQEAIDEYERQVEDMEDEPGFNNICSVTLESSEDGTIKEAMLTAEVKIDFKIDQY